MASSSLRSLVKDALNPSETVLVHGTSVATALQLLTEGKMTLDLYNEHPKPTFPGYLFFIHNYPMFAGHPFEQRLVDHSWETVIKIVESYAMTLGQINFFNSQVGFYQHNPELDEFDMDPGKDFPPLDMHPFKQSLLDKLFLDLESKGFSHDFVSGLLQDANKRQGVLIGTGRNIFEQDLNLEEEFDEELKDELYDSVRIHLPGGLDARYVNAIVPLGDIERKLLTPYV